MAGSIEKRGANTFRLTVSGGFDGDGKRIKYTKTVKCASDREANKELARFIVAVENQQHTTSGKMTLNDLYNYWRENYALKNHTPTTIVYNDFIYNRIRTALGHKRIDKIEPRHIQTFLKNLAEPGVRIDPNEKRRKKKPNEEAEIIPKKDTLSTNTIRKHYALLSSLFTKAQKWGLLPYNPVERTEQPKQEHNHKEIYDQENLGRFLKALENEEIKCQLWILLALTGGLRREEIFGLEWKHINFEASAVQIQQASVYTSVTGTITKGTKNKTSTRTVSIPSSVTVLLKQHKVEQNEIRLKLGDKWHESKRVFTQWNGLPAHPHSFNTWLRRFCDEINLPQMSPHMFRHMAATYLITKGTDIRTVSGKLGHARPSITFDTYSHLLQSAEQETANTMEELLESMKVQESSKQ